MAVDVADEIAITATRAEVAAVMFDPKFDKVWISGVVNSFPRSPGKLTMGSKVERVADFLNKRYSAVFDVIRAEPDSLVEMSADEPFQLKVTYRLRDSTDSETIAEIHVKSVGEVPFSMPAPLLAKAVGGMISRDLKRLKKLVEELDTP